MVKYFNVACRDTTSYCFSSVTPCSAPPPSWTSWQACRRRQPESVCSLLNICLRHLLISLEQLLPLLTVPLVVLVAFALDCAASKQAADSSLPQPNSFSTEKCHCCQSKLSWSVFCTVFCLLSAVFSAAANYFNCRCSVKEKTSKTIRYFYYCPS